MISFEFGRGGDDVAGQRTTRLRLLVAFVAVVLEVRLHARRQVTGEALNATRIAAAFDGLQDIEDDRFVAMAGEADASLVQPVGGIQYDIAQE